MHVKHKTRKQTHPSVDWRGSGGSSRPESVLRRNTSSPSPWNAVAPYMDRHTVRMNTRPAPERQPEISAVSLMLRSGPSCKHALGGETLRLLASTATESRAHLCRVLEARYGRAQRVCGCSYAGSDCCGYRPRVRKFSPYIWGTVSVRCRSWRHCVSMRCDRAAAWWRQP